ncbi:MAG TPA: hypothetical protein VF087_12805 [Solirubrobacteraceae bacterium]
MPDSDEPTDQERATIALLAGLRADGDAAALIALLQDGREGPARVRDALIVLADLDPELIVQLALDALIEAYVGDPVAAQQRRRMVRDSA